MRTIALACVAGLTACEDETPVCSGTVTPDLGEGATPGCRGAWEVTGGQLCPQQFYCGVPSRCSSFDDFPAGSCTCPGPAPHTLDVCCGLSIVSPADGATLTAADDIDPATDGIQVEVDVQGEECWPMWTQGPVVHPCDVATGLSATPAHWDRATGRAAATVDLAGRTGCVPVCADMLAIGEVARSASVRLCLP